MLVQQLSRDRHGAQPGTSSTSLGVLSRMMLSRITAAASRTLSPPPRPAIGGGRRFGEFVRGRQRGRLAEYVGEIVRGAAARQPQAQRRNNQRSG